MKDLILIIGEEKNQFEIKEELIQFLLGEDYYDLTEEEQQKRRYIKAIANVKGDENKISTAIQGSKDSFFINNEDAYIISLLKMNKIVLLERKGAKVYTDKINIENEEGNYIILNSFADELLEKINQDT